MFIKRPVKKAEDEEDRLYIDQRNSNYGSIHLSSEDASSIEGASSIKKRKKRRMAQRQCFKPGTAIMFLIVNIVTNHG